MTKHKKKKHLEFCLNSPKINDFQKNVIICI